MFTVYGPEGPDPAVASACLREAGAVEHATGRDRFAGIEPGLSVREGMDQLNYEFFRPGDATPKRKNSVIETADNAYRYNGVIRFVIDMMTDFVTQGMEIYHPAASKQRTYRHWWKKVNGHAASVHIVNLLYRHGTAIVKRNYGQLNAGDMKDLGRGVASADDLDPDSDVDFVRSIRPRKNRIPLQYTCLNPLMVEVIGGELAMFAHSVMNPVRYGLRIPQGVLRAIRNPKTDAEKQIVANLPNYVLSAASSGTKLVPLDPEKVSVLHYKKDDWQLWGDPVVLSILDDILLYRKMKKADEAALDGSISRVRLWTLGLPEHQIQPGPGAFRRLRDQLLAAGRGGSIDLIWDASLKLSETSSDVYRFLGDQKYEPVLRAIYAGLGIPQSMVGGDAGGMTSNALSLKTLIERLQYVRNLLIDFWEREFYLLQRAFGDRQPARLRFEMMTLSDEAAEKMIWVQLYDRNVVTTETMREKFGLLNDVEESRLRREYRRADAGDSPAKIGPFTEAQPHPDQLAKAAMQQGSIAPTQAGVKLKPKAKGDRSMLDRQDDLQREQMDNQQELAERELEVKQQQGEDVHRQKLQQNDDLHQQKIAQKDAEHKAALPIKTKALADKMKAKQKGQPGQGRPANSKDSVPRKKRTPKPT